MIIQDVLVKTLDFVRVEIIHADVIKNRDDGHLITHQHGFGLLKKFFPLLQIGLLVGLVR